LPSLLKKLGCLQSFIFLVCCHDHHRSQLTVLCPHTYVGTTSLHLELEKSVAAFVGKEQAVVFGMGYATNSAVIPVLAGKGCLIISDALNHASIVVGARASGAKVKVFRHNDAVHLEDVLRASISEGQPRSHRPWKKVDGVVDRWGDDEMACC
jgi:serine palmitoyltransferase